MPIVESPMTRIRRVLAAAVMRRYPFRLGALWLTERLSGGVLPPAGLWVRSRSGPVYRTRRDQMFSLLYYAGTYEPDESAVVRDLLRPGETAVDVGANFGWYTGLFAHLVGPSGRVIAFEPLPDLFETLRDTVAANRFEDRVVTRNAGLGDEVGDMTIYVFDGLPIGHASASDLNRDDAQEHFCQVVRLDDALDEIGVTQVHLVKCDVEGYELEVFRGARQTLSSESAPLVLFEGNVEVSQHRGHQVGDLFSLLSSMGYRRFFRIEKGGALKPVDRHEPFFGSANYLAAKPAHEVIVARLGHRVVRS